MDADYYEVLGREPGASRDDVEPAYRRWARQIQLDAGGNAALFRFVQHVYEPLVNPRHAPSTRISGADRSRCCGCGLHWH